jgi:hypothetical protein
MRRSGYYPLRPGSALPGLRRYPSVACVVIAHFGGEHFVLCFVSVVVALENIHCTIVLVLGSPEWRESHKTEIGLVVFVVVVEKLVRK